MSEAIKINQDMLMLLGYYPPRMHRDGIPGNAYRVGIIAFKRWLITHSVVDPDDIHWRDNRTNEEIAILDHLTRELLEEATTLGSVRGVPCPRVPHGEDVIRCGSPRVALEASDVPMEWLLAMLEHETRGTWTVSWGDYEHVMIYGCDYYEPRYPTDLEAVDRDMPIVSRGWGPGQITPTQRLHGEHVGHLMPPRDEFGLTPSGEWPIWTRDCLANLEVAAQLFGRKFLYASSIRHECSCTIRHDCRRCVDARWREGEYRGEVTQAYLCSWLEAVRRYAGDGPGANEFLLECRDILLEAK